MHTLIYYVHMVVCIQWWIDCQNFLMHFNMFLRSFIIVHVSAVYV